MKLSLVKVVMVCVLLTGFLEGCKSNQPKRHGKMPRKGAIPCPVKDC